MSIHFYNEDVVFPALDFDLLQSVLKYKIRVAKGKLGTINYIFCSDEYLLELNIKFLNHDYYTDVITFDYSEHPLVAGDIYISTERVKHNSITFNQDFNDELVRVISHGLLHLLKYDDKEAEDIAEMRRMESFLLSRYISMGKSKID